MSLFTPCMYTCFRPGFRVFSIAGGVLVGAILVPGLARGAGFALNESSASAAGTAYAGRAARAQDASALAANPAAISSLEQEQWTLGGALIVPAGKTKEYSATEIGVTPAGPRPRSVTGGSGKPFVDKQLVPGAYYAKPLNEQLTVGVGLYVPFGVETDYKREFVGRFLARKSGVQNINIQPTLSYQFDPQFSAGVGIFASHIKGELTQSKTLLVPTPDRKGVALQAIGQSKVTGDGWRLGAKIGGLWQTDRVSVGIAYTMPVNFKMKGKVKLTAEESVYPRPNLNVSALNAKADGHLNVKLPQMFEIGGSYTLTPKWELVAGALWTGWSSFKEIRVVVDEPFGPLPKDSTVSYVPEKWKNVWSFSTGARYAINSQWLLRLGYGLDKSPIKDERRTARIPDTDRNWLTVGARFQRDTTWLVDMAYGYLLPKTVRVNEHSHNARTGKPDGISSYKGKYTMNAHVAMASLTYRY